jgi:sulfatase modifying factor 1
MPPSPVRFTRRWTVAALLAGVLLGGGLALWNWYGHQAAQQAASERMYCPLPAEAAGHRHPGMAWVPGGSFDYGDTVYPEEQPVRRATVDGFWIDRTEVTNDAFAQFVQATGYITVAERPVDPRLHPDLPPEMRLPGAVVFEMPNSVSGTGDIRQWWRYVPGASWRHPGGPSTDITGRGAFPVVAVTYEDAMAYARWKGRSLPTEVQWEWAARAGQPVSATPHAQPREANTWQGLFPVANSAEDGFVGLAPVGCFAPNAAGLSDMLGNVWELTADAYTPDHAGDDQPASPVAPVVRVAAEGQRVIKGGSFLCAPSYCMRYRAGARQAQEGDLGASHVGFRTILKAPGP